MEKLIMNKETLEFDNARADVSLIDNLVYIRVSGVYTDEVALQLIQYLEELSDRRPDSLIRVWDASGISEGAFQLSTKCVEQIAAWARKITAGKPGSLAYMVGTSAISYGMARMYAIKSGLEETAVIVLRSIDELPPAIREKLPV
jgi:hypothetical protein